MSVRSSAAPCPGGVTSLDELHGISVQGDECYIRCAKAFKRSGLWEPGRWPDRGDMASISQMLVDHVHTPGVTLAAVDQALEHSYGNTLY